MFKQAFQSYLKTLLPTKRGMQNKEQKENLFSILFILIFTCLFYDTTILEVVLKFIPFVLIKWSNLGVGSYMGKAMLLCPMRKDQRRAYINYMIGFKIGCPVVLGIFLISFCSIKNNFDANQFIILILAYISYGIAENIHIDCIDRIDKRVLPGRKDAEGIVKWSWWNYSVSAVALFMLLDIGLGELEGVRGQFENILAMVGSVYLIVMDIVIFAKQYKDMIEETIDYELAFHVPGRLHYVKQE